MATRDRPASDPAERGSEVKLAELPSLLRALVRLPFFSLFIRKKTGPSKPGKTVKIVKTAGQDADGSLVESANGGPCDVLPDFIREDFHAPVLVSDDVIKVEPVNARGGRVYEQLPHNDRDRVHVFDKRAQWWDWRRG